MQGAKLKSQIGMILRKDFDTLQLVKSLLDSSLKQPLVILSDEEQMWVQIANAIETISNKSQRQLKQMEFRAAKLADKVVEENEQEQSEQQEESEQQEDQEQQEQQELQASQQIEEEPEYDQEDGNFRFEGKKQKDDFEEFEKYMQDYDDGKLDKINLEESEVEEEPEEQEQEPLQQDEDYEGEDSVFDEIREQQLNDPEIAELEQKRLNKKDWQLVGEVKGRQRPLNSLIEQDLDFEVNRKVLDEAAPDQQLTLIDLIKKRVQDELYDDRQKVTVNLQSLEKPADTVDTNKSQFGLAELYERQFKQALGLPTNTSEQKLKQELFEMFRDLCYKLDSLSNLNFEPRGFVKQAEVKVLENSVIQKEEKVPITLRGEQTEQIEKIKKTGFTTKPENDHEINKKEHRMVKQRKRNRERSRKQAGLVKKLESRGETKFMYNQHQKGKKQLSLIKDKKKQQSVKFDKTSTFFKNLQESGVQKKITK